MNTPARRNTKQRRAVMAELVARNEFRSAQQIHEDMATHGERIGLATVYRNLRALADDGVVDVVMGADGEALYRQCDLGHRHHHHLVCRTCYRSEEIELGDTEQWIESLAQRHGFSQIEHSIELFGICSDCAGDTIDR